MYGHILSDSYLGMSCVVRCSEKTGLIKIIENIQQTASVIPLEASQADNTLCLPISELFRKENSLDADLTIKVRTGTRVCIIPKGTWHIISKNKVY